MAIVATPGSKDSASAVGTDGGTCLAAGSTPASSSNYVVQASHGQVLYIDTGQGQRVDAAYVGYRVTKGTSSTANADVWVKLDGFDTNEVVQLANTNDASYQLGSVTGGTKAAYFLLKAPKPTTTPQSHVVHIYEGNPDSGGTEQYYCSFSFSKVRETIKASANKVSSVTSTTAAYIGGDLVVTHKGATGTIGAGSLPDNDVIWISPASNSSWPTRAFRLTNVSIEYFSNKNFNGNSLVTSNQLILKPAVNSIPAGGNNTDTPASYQAVYTFKIIGPGAGAIAPVAQISSGTQIKHTDMGGFYNTDGTAKFSASSTTLPISLTASKAGTGASQSGANVNIGYRITLANSGATDLIVDSIVDTAASSLTFTGTATKGATPTSIAAPTSTPGPTGYNNWTFQGPFTVPANGTLPINYTMQATCVSGTQTYLNSAQAKLGDLSIGANAGEYTQVTTSMTQSVSGSTCTVSNSTQSVTRLTMPVEVVTSSAKNVNTTTNSNGDATSSATLTGTVDSNGTAGSTIQCEYSTDPGLASSTLTTVTTPANGVTTSDTAPIQVECALTGLLPGTTYYYRVKVGSNLGDILSFTTPMPTYASPTVATNSVSNVTTSSATFNGTVNSRGNASRVGFLYKLSDNNGVDTTCNTGTATDQQYLDKDETGSTPVPINLVLTGLYDTSVIFDATGLTNNKRYCYKVYADYVWTATSTTAGTSSVGRLEGAWVNFKVSSINPPTPTTNPATSILSTSATLNGSVVAGTGAASVKYCYSTTAPTTAVLRDCLGTSPPQTASTGDAVTAGATLANTYSATNLIAGTKYYFQVIATDSTNELIYANVESFTTPGPPIATTNDATNVQSSTATINGQVQANGAATNVYFCYIAASLFADSNSDGYMDSCITTSAIDTSKTVDPSITTQIASADTANRSANLTGLTPNTLYKFQVLAKNTNGEAKGAILTFTTDPLPPVPVTDAADPVGYTTATLNSTVATKSYSATITFCISATGNVAANTIDTCLSGKLGTVTGGSMALNSNATPSVVATGLSTNTTYYFRVIATPSSGPVVYGAVRSFTTLTQGPAPTTNNATSVSYTSATLNGSVTSHTYGTTNSFCISTTGDVGANTIGTCLTGTLGSVTGSTQLANASSTPSVAASGLTHNTTYYFRVTATPSTGSAVNGAVVSFTTLQIINPSPVTVSADQVSATTARIRSSVASNTFPLSSITFCISATGSTGSPGTIGTCGVGSAGTISTSSLVANSSATPSQVISGLTSNTTYYFRISVTDNQGNTFTGDVLSFTTDIILATATTTSASPVTDADAHLNGTTQTGTFGGTVDFCFSTTGNVASNTIGVCRSGNQAVATNSSPGSLTSSSHSAEVTGLSPSTTYYFRIFITPATGSTVYGEVKSFTTNAQGAPTAQTDAADQISETAARLNSEIMGGANGANATFCISTTGNTGANTIGSCGAGTQGSVSPSSATTNDTVRPAVIVTGLTAGTTYYFRVTATPTTGSPVNGIVRSFTTDTPPSGTTNAAQNITETSATLPATAVVGSRNATVTFCLSTTGNTGSNTIGTCDSSKLGTVTNGSANANSTVGASVAATGLTGSTTYYFRVIVTPSAGTTANGNVLNFTTSAAAVNNNGNGNGGGSGGGGGGGGGNTTATPTPTPTASPTPTSRPTPSSRPTRTPAPSRTTAPVPIPLPSAAPSPAPRVTPSPAPSPQASQTPVPVTEVTKNINSVLNKANELINEPNNAKPTVVASAKPNSGNKPDPTPSTDSSSPTSVVTVDKPAGTKDLFNAATRTIPTLAAEKFTGYASGAGLRVEVIGSRIAGQFVVVPGDSPDPIAIAAALEESTARQNTSFASINSVVRVIPPNADEVFSSKITDNEIQIFKASGLAAPKSLSDLKISKATKWIKVDASARTYLPGTIVYLTVTTQPIIFGSALVDKYGRANLTGQLPLDLLGSGGHSIRLVGIRSLEGVSTDNAGEIKLSDSAMAEIKKFDDGTKATVILSGSTGEGNFQTSVREVPLDRIIPWWTVWLALIVGILALAARFIRRPVGQKRRIALIVLSFAAGLPAGILGWLNVVYEVWIGLGIAVVFTIVQLFWGRKKRNR